MFFALQRRYVLSWYRPLAVCGEGVADRVVGGPVEAACRHRLPPGGPELLQHDLCGRVDGRYAPGERHLIAGRRLHLRRGERDQRRHPLVHGVTTEPSRRHIPPAVAVEPHGDRVPACRIGARRRGRMKSPLSGEPSPQEDDRVPVTGSRQPARDRDRLPVRRGIRSARDRQAERAAPPIAVGGVRTAQGLTSVDRNATARSGRGRRRLDGRAGKREPSADRNEQQRPRKQSRSGLAHAVLPGSDTGVCSRACLNPLSRV